MLELRLASPEEYDRLYDEGFEWTLCPSTSKVIVAELDGELVGAIVFRTELHLEPLWVKEEKRGSNIAMRLFKKALELIPDDLSAYCSTKNEKLSEIAKKRYGFKEWGEALVRN